MRLPKKVIIAGVDVPVRLSDELGDNVSGQWSNELQEIIISRTAEREQKPWTLFHECLHALFHLSGWARYTKPHVELPVESLENTLRIDVTDEPLLLLSNGTLPRTKFAKELKKYYQEFNLITDDPPEEWYCLALNLLVNTGMDLRIVDKDMYILAIARGIKDIIEDNPTLKKRNGRIRQETKSRRL